MKSRFVRALLSTLCLACSSAFAQFNAGISPPRFEVEAKAGTTERRVIEVSNPLSTPAQFKVYTSDWKMSESGELTFFDDLQPDSCRPWIALERRSFTLPAGAKVRFRFEVQLPAEWSGAECRAMIFFEGDEVAKDGRAVSTNGRIGVAVYVRSSSAAMSAAVSGVTMLDSGGAKLPALLVKNTGNATVRTSGNFQGQDANGKRWYFSASGTPILPGQTRPVLLTAIDPMKPNAKVDGLWQGQMELKGRLSLTETRRVTLPVAVTLPSQW